MSGAKVCTNPKKIRPWCNTKRPNGCDRITESSDPLHWFEASLFGNRATKREAMRKIKNNARCWAKSPEGMAYLRSDSEDGKGSTN